MLFALICKRHHDGIIQPIAAARYAKRARHFRISQCKSFPDQNRSLPPRQWESGQGTVSSEE